MTDRLTELEARADKMGIHIHYDLLEAAGLKLKGGLCKINGELHLFVDRRKSFADKVEMLKDYLDHPLPKNIPSNQ